VIRILHLSDLHVSRADWENRERIVSAMLKDAKSYAAERPIDLAVFSGDLAKEGLPEEFKLGRELLLDRLVSELGVAPERVVLVPGNHDVDRRAIRDIVEHGLASTLTEEPAVDNATVAIAVSAYRSMDDEGVAATVLAVLRERLAPAVEAGQMAPMRSRRKRSGSPARWSRAGAGTRASRSARRIRRQRLARNGKRLLRLRAKRTANGPQPGRDITDVMVRVGSATDACRNPLGRVAQRLSGARRGGGEQ